eukprot:jgi/Botrbrau1/744/Bobra.0181s0003.1
MPFHEFRPRTQMKNGLCGGAGEAIRRTGIIRSKAFHHIVVDCQTFRNIETSGPPPSLSGMPPTPELKGVGIHLATKQEVYRARGGLCECMSRNTHAYLTACSYIHRSL